MYKIAIYSAISVFFISLIMIFSKLGLFFEYQGIRMWFIVAILAILTIIIWIVSKTENKSKLYRSGSKFLLFLTLSMAFLTWLSEDSRESIAQKGVYDRVVARVLDNPNASVDIFESLDDNDLYKLSERIPEQANRELKRREIFRSESQKFEIAERKRKHEEYANSVMGQIHMTLQFFYHIFFGRRG